MTPPQPGGSAPSIKLGDILFVVFRHKWKIISISLVAVIAAVLFPILQPAPFESRARLYIRYVVETSSPTTSTDNDRIRPDLRGNTIINTELQILTSMDLAQQVADAVGPEKVLGKAARETNRLFAAAVIQNSIQALVPRDSTVVNLAFQHPDPEVAQSVLTRLIESYFKKHAEIHQVGAFDEFLAQETDQMRSRLAQTAEELRKEKARLGITSIEETRRTLDTQISTLQQQKLATQAELAEQRAMLTELLRQHGAPAAGVSNTAAAATASTSSNSVAATSFAASAPADKLAEYRRISGLIETLSRREQELLMTYTEQYALVKVVRSQMQANQRLKADLEAAYPSLVSVPVSNPSTPAAPGQPEGRDELTTQMAHVRGLESRLQELTTQYDDAQKRAAVFYEAEGTLTELQRKLHLEETNYMRFSHNLEQSRIDERLGAGKVSNISVIQAPTAPIPAESKTLKIAAGILFGGIAVAFSLAFLIEFYLDQTLRRPTEIQPKLGVPLFLSIPLQQLNGNQKQVGHPAHRPLLTQHSSAGPQPQAPSSALQAPSSGSPSDTSALSLQPSALASTETPSTETPSTVQWDTPPWDSRHQMQPFFETLRDRLIQYFEARNLTHKPKLVSVTSCDHAAGVSTIAAGLAASLSETGEGNVLLVDMNVANGSARRFYKGDLACGLDDALEKETRQQALVQDKLYVVTESNPGEGLPTALPTRFKSLVPRLKASDFDYIIFDMPPVTEISITPRLSKFMDTVLMVVEAEKTDLEVVRRANTILAESKANVGIVFNKQRTYVPKLLQKEL